jgi:hypothetical protein
LIRCRTARLCGPGEQSIANRVPSSGSYLFDMLLRRRVVGDRRLDFAANAAQHSKLARRVALAGNSRIEVHFGLVDPILSNEWVHDPPGVTGAPHFG